MSGRMSGSGGDPGSVSEIRWDLGRMAEMSALLERRSRALHAARIRCIETYDVRSSPPPPLRRIVLAAEWSIEASGDLLWRREALLAAEAEFIWHLSNRTRSDPFRPDLQARSPATIVAELELALETPATAANPGSVNPDLPDHHRIARLIHELAVAEHHRLLMSPEPPAPGLLMELTELINYLGYQLTRRRPSGDIDWSRVFTTLDDVRAGLNESWFGDVSRHELRLIGTRLEALDGPEFDAVIGLLTDDELYRWFHELDGVRGGNFDAADEAELFRHVAERASPATLLRLALAEHGSRLTEIAAAIRKTAPLEVAMEFVELCASRAAESEQLLAASLAGLAALDPAPRRVVLTSLQSAGMLDPLAAAATALIERHSVERSEPLLVEFFSGLLAALRDGAVGIADLTVVGLVDRHRFREAWSALGKVVALAATDPAELAAALIDIDTMRRNPARWLGATTADLAVMGLGKLARIGRMGRAARALADLMKRLSKTRIVRAGKLQLEAGHIHDLIGRLNAAADALELRALLDQVEAIVETAAQVESAVGEIDSVPVDSAVSILKGVVARVTAQIAALGVIAWRDLPPPQTIESSVPAT